MTKIKITLFYNIATICFVVLILSCVQTLAQDTANTQTAVPANGQSNYTMPDGGLQIGDAIPDEVWNMSLKVVNHPEGKEVITLVDYKDKLIIIDFWATWCVPCIKSLYKLDTLQGQFTDELAIIPTTYESGAKAESFFQHRDWTLQTAVEETTLKRYFPHKSVPHQIWIKDGKVKAVTSASEATVANIEKAISIAEFSIKEKKDILDYDPLQNISVYAERTSSATLMSSTITAFIEGIPSTFGTRKVNDTTVINYTNMPVVSIYRDVLGISTNRILLNNNLKKLFVDPEDEKKLHCYQLKIPTRFPKSSIQQIIVDDLNSYFQLKIDSQIVDVDCYVISRSNTSSAEEIRNLESKTTNKQTVDFPTFVELLNFHLDWAPDQPVFIDESQYDHQVPYQSYKTMQQNPDVLKLELSSYGLTVTKERRHTMMYFVIEVSGKNNN